MKEHELPTADGILANAEQCFDVAYRKLGDAGDWLRSDWQPVGSPLTSEQAARKARMWRAIRDAKEAIDEGLG